jgi:hypothetical protein
MEKNRQGMDGTIVLERLESPTDDEVFDSIEKEASGEKQPLRKSFSLKHK